MSRKIAIIQARMGSSRLPGKILMKLNGISILQHIINRVKAASLVDDVVVGTTVCSTDDLVANFCNEQNIKCYRGSEENVLERFYKAALQHQADIIIRITADDPLKDPEIIDKAIKLLIDGYYDYVSNTIYPTYPEGIDVEVFTYKSLEKAYHEASLLSEKEHVTPYIWKNPDKFKILNFEAEQDLSSMRWTLDTIDDYKFIEKIYEALYNSKKIFLMNDVLQLLQEKPELLELNSGHVRNEGYLKSLKNEAK